MKPSIRLLAPVIGALALALAPGAWAADYSLAGGAVQFSAPAAWPMLMEKLNGPRQFVALQVKSPQNPGVLARVTVTTEQVDGTAGFSQFLSQGTARARKLPGYQNQAGIGAAAGLHYTATENHHSNAYAEYYAFRHNQIAVQVRCFRPEEAPADWRATFDAGCKAIVAAVEH